jgi:hypothetical protein
MSSSYRLVRLPRQSSGLATHSRAATHSATSDSLKGQVYRDDPFACQSRSSQLKRPNSDGNPSEWIESSQWISRWNVDRRGLKILAIVPTEPSVQNHRISGQVDRTLEISMIGKLRWALLDSFLTGCDTPVVHELPGRIYEEKMPVGRATGGQQVQVIHRKGERRRG